MTSELGNLGQGRISPDDDLILGVAMSAHKLIGTLRPSQVAYLSIKKTQQVRVVNHLIQGR